MTRQAIVLDDVSQDPRFAEDAAKKTGFVPKGLMCVPLIHREEPPRCALRPRPAAAVAVLARGDGAPWPLREPGGDRARPARKARRAKAVLDDEDTDCALLARVAENLEELDGQRRAAGVELLRSLEALFKH